MTSVTAEPVTARPAPAEVVIPRLHNEPIRPVPMSRLVRMEIRKLSDTRAGRWLLLCIGLTVAAVLVIMVFTQNDNNTFTAYFLGTATPLLILVPLVGVLAATAEWSQRTALATFALEPRRSRVVAAKTIASVVAAAASYALSFVLAAVAYLAMTVFRDRPADWSLNGAVAAGAGLALFLGLIQGVAFGLALLNTPAAIVAYLGLPTLWSILGGLISGLRDVLPWIDLGAASNPLFQGTMTASAWAHIGTASLLWVVLPLAIGWYRVRRSEPA